MPYHMNPEITTPSRDTAIWRYMDVLPFLTMLKQRSLYFALLKEFEDKWEGSPSNRLKGDLPRFGPNMRSAFETLRRHWAVSCWHENPSESVAMWSLYISGAHGIAIRSSVGRLIASLEASPRRVFIGKVTYEDHHLESIDSRPKIRLNMMSAPLQKRECYRHEAEVRAMVSLVGPNTPLESVPGQAYDDAAPDHGILVDVDLDVLVENVVASASFPQWGRDVVKDAMEQAGLQLNFDTSAMLLQPS
jgi:hypothetical protein